MEKITSSIQYAKGWIVSVGGVVSAILVALIAGGYPIPAWLPIVSIIITAIGTIAVPNEPSDAIKQKIVDAAVADPNVPVVASGSVAAYEAPVLTNADITVPAPAPVDPLIDNVDTVTEAEQKTGH